MSKSVYLMQPAAMSVVFYLYLAFFLFVYIPHASLHDGVIAMGMGWIICLFIW